MTTDNRASRWAQSDFAKWTLITSAAAAIGFALTVAVELMFEYLGRYPEWCAEPWFTDPHRPPPDNVTSLGTVYVIVTTALAGFSGGMVSNLVARGKPVWLSLLPGAVLAAILGVADIQAGSDSPLRGMHPIGSLGGGLLAFYCVRLLARRRATKAAPADSSRTSNQC